MRFSRFMDSATARDLALDHVSTDLKTFLTRELLATTVRRDSPDAAEIELIFMNRLINLARTVIGGKIYVLESDDHGMYLPPEYAWHNGEFHLMLRRMNSAELAEMLCEVIEHGYLDIDDVNRWLAQEGARFRIDHNLDRLAVSAVHAIEDDPEEDGTHPNIGALIDRMERLHKAKDYPGVLHASASVYETMAKDVVGLDSVGDQTLGAFFERYRKNTSLPDPVCDYILAVYKSRNSTPLSGHGSLDDPPDVDDQQAALLVELTKAFVRAEYRTLLAARAE